MSPVRLRRGSDRACGFFAGPLRVVIPGGALLIDSVEYEAPVPIDGLLKSVGCPGGDLAATKEVGLRAAVWKWH